LSSDSDFGVLATLAGSSEPNNPDNASAITSFGYIVSFSFGNSATFNLFCSIFFSV